MTPTSDGAREAPLGGATMFLFRLALLAALVAATLALASPRGGGAPAPQVASGASCDLEQQLPPGHPPIFGQRAWPGGHPALPPGHPSIDGPAARFARPAPPMALTFEPPGTIDI